MATQDAEYQVQENNEKERLISTDSRPTPCYDGISNHISSLHDSNSETICSGVDLTSVHVFKRRWYILLVFSLLNATQCGIWNTWGPLTQSACYAFGWSLADIALLTNWGPITYIISMLFFSWVMDVKGLRWACLSSAGLVALGAALRCFTSDPSVATCLMHCGQIMNGFAGPVFMAGPPLLSATWFAPDERTTATSIALLSSGVGVAGSFILGPLLVPDLQNSDKNSSFHKSDGWPVDMSALYSNSSSDKNILLTRDYIMRYMYIVAGWSGILFVLILVYFPSKPSRAPSITATVDRVDFKSGLKELLKHGSFWKIGLCYAISIGVCDEWMSFIDPILNETLKNVDGDTADHQVEAGWLGFYSSIGGGLVGCAVARFSDAFTRHMKLLLTVLFSVSLLASVAFALDAGSFIPVNKGYLFAGYIIVSVVVGGCTPLFYEIACESTYPIAEGVTNGLLTLLNNVVGLIFLLILMIPNIGTQWMNWTMAGSILICIPVIMLHHSTYNRLDVDLPTSSQNAELPIPAQMSVNSDESRSELTSSVPLNC